MRGFRAGSSAFSSIVLLWQLAVVIVMPAALCCQSSSSSDRSNGSDHEMMADCPMNHETPVTAEPSCPLHNAKSGTHECDCPTLGCSQTDKGFMAVFGPIGVLPAPTLLTGLDLTGDTPATVTESAIGLAPDPLSPPPRT
jgi:hypothetical protein